MPLGAREILLTIRARDLASSVLAAVAVQFGAFEGMSAAATRAALANTRAQMAFGGAIAAVGVAFAAAGVAGTKALVNWADAAKEYNNETAKTLTQTDGVGTSLKELGDIGIQVATQVAVPLKDMQEGLYNIFSSMDVTVPQAKDLLTAFAKEAVAGQVSLQDASKGTIGIMNAYKIPVEDVSHVLDVQFQLVRKGVGTFADFNSVIGRVTPSAVRAGQSFETTAGMLAFLTRNGLSAAMASSSAARALDTISNPLTVQRLEAMGIAVKDANGEFLPMTTIIGQLSEKLDGLTGPQRSQALNDLFKGAGNTIQARRFFDLALTNFPQYKALTDSMSDSTGAFEQAYDTMSTQSAAKTQLLKNNWDALKITVGEALIPVLNFLVANLTKIVQWFNNLGDGTKKAIAYTLGIISVLSILLGIGLIVAGMWLMFAAAAALVGIGIGTIIGIIALVIVAIIALIAAIFLVIKYHKQIGEAMVTAWQAVADFFVALWGYVSRFFIRIWNDIANFFTGIWNSISSGFMTGLNAVRDFFVGIWTDISNFFVGIWNSIYNFITGVLTGIKDFFVSAWGAIRDFFVGVWDGFYNIVSSALTSIWGFITSAFDTIHDIFFKYWRLYLAVVTLGLSLIITQIYRWIDEAWPAISGFFQNVYDFIVRILTDVNNFLVGIFDTIGSTIANWATTAYNVVVTIWTSISDFFVMLWNNIYAFFSSVLTTIGTTIASWSSTVWQGIVTAWNAIKDFFVTVWNAIWSWIVSVSGSIWTTISGWLTTVWNGITSIWNQIAGFFVTVWNGIWQGIVAVLGFITSSISGAWDTIFSTARGFMTTFSGWIVGAWTTIWNGIKAAADTGVRLLGDAWSKIESVMVGPVNWVITHVINGGLLKVWNWAADLVHLGGASPLPTISGFATGGQIPGYGGGDRWPILAEGGEWVINKQSSRKYNQILAMINADKFADGGIIGGVEALFGGASNFFNSIPGAIANVNGIVWNWVQNGIANGMEAMLAPIRASLGALGGDKWAQIVRGFATAPMDAMVGIIRGQESTAINNAIDSTINGLRTLAGQMAPGMGQAAPGSQHANGLWEAPSNAIVGIHKREMIVPADLADAIRQGSRASGNSVHVEQHITTQEIDPRVHAAQLGYELMRRVG